MKKSLPARLAAAFLAFTAAVSSAQTPPPAVETNRPKEEAVVLTAFEVASTRETGYRATNSVSGTRVNVKLMDVPQTISVLTSDFIQDIGATDLDEALIYTSGVGTAGFSAGQYTIRGFQTGSPRRNGINFSTTNAIDTSVVDRVEVVKGPSSALYGTGGPGGVVNVVTKQPQAKRATAIETASMALAPRRDLLSVPSKSIRVLSRKACSEASRPSTASEISVLMNSTARNTPLPPYRFLSPSRSSIASRLPVDAPEGTAARPMVPDSNSTSHSTVGLPRLSKISRPTMSTMALIKALSKGRVVQQSLAAPGCT